MAPEASTHRSIPTTPMIKHLTLGISSTLSVTLTLTLALTLALTLGLFLSACSGGGGSSAAPNPGGPAFDAHIVNNTAGGAGGRLYGRVSALALEDGQGKLTGSLIVGTNPEFIISDPLGAAFGLELKDFGPGKFVKVHVMFMPGSVMFRKGTAAPKPVTIIGGSIIAPFTATFEAKTFGAHRIQLRHKSPVVLKTNTNGDLTWVPAMVSEASGLVLLQEAEIEILSVDIAKQTAFGVIESMAGLKTTVSFLSTAVLVIGGEEKTVAEFLGALQPKDVISVFGILDALSNTKVAFAERIDPLGSTPGNGRKNKVRGTITAATKSAIEVDLFEIRIGGRDIPKNQPVTLDVDSTTAKIKYVPRYGRHSGHLDPSSLAVDMFVEVEWHGPAPKLQIAAHKINIRSDGRLDFLSKVAGTVKSVDTTASTITLSGEFEFGSEKYTELTVAVGVNTLLVTEKGGVAIELKLSDIMPNNKLWLFGRKQAGANIDAMMVVVVP